MNAPLAKEQIALLMSDSLTYRSPAVTGTDSAYAEPHPSVLAAVGQRVKELFARVAALPRRAAVLNELSRMSDRELADIGLNRHELTQVFDPALANARRT